MEQKNTPGRLSLFAIIGPGILVAATGVGAGDLATGAFTGNKLGVAVLWAVILGAVFKFTLNEGLARWQLATGTTMLEGTVRHLGRAVQWVFLFYLLIWSFFTGAALMSAIGVTTHAICPIFQPQQDKVLFGMLHSVVAAILVFYGGYRLFEKMMSVCIGIMFTVVIATAIATRPAWGQILRGLFVPDLQQFQGEGLTWTIGLIGGVGGTLTILCYGYWIREEGRQGASFLGTCRLDLLSGYVMTALFGIAMVIIGSRLPVLTRANSASLLAEIAEHLRQQFGGIAGSVAKWSFLVGAWGAVFSSMLGVWQSVPYLFADFYRLVRFTDGPTSNNGAAGVVVNTRSLPYRAYLVALAIVPAIGLQGLNFQQAQKIYAVFGALFVPLLAAVLLILNGRRDLVGKLRNGWLSMLLLIACLVFFGYSGATTIQAKLWPKAAPAASSSSKSAAQQPATETESPEKTNPEKTNPEKTNPE